MTDYASELLSGHTEEKKKPEGFDYAKELFEPKILGEPVGGTFMPTNVISTITSKPIEKYVPPKEPEAGFLTSMKASFADRPETRVRIYARARGIPVSRYRIREGNIEFQDDEGNWQREVGETGESKIKKFGAEVVAHPSTYTGPAGAMVGGAPGAVGGAMLGEVARKGVGKLVYGEEIEPLGDLTDVALMGIFAIGGEMASKVVGWGINRFIQRGTGVVKRAGPEISQGILKPADHAKALYIQQLARQFDIELAPHQLYDKEGMINMWKYLRKHPLTSDAVQEFDRKLEQSGEKAITGFIEEMGGYKKTPLGLGEKIKTEAEKAIDIEELKRAEKVGPMYEKAFKEAGRIDLDPAIDKIDDIIAGTPEGPSKSALLRVKKSLMTETKEPAKEPTFKIEMGGGKPGIEEENFPGSEFFDIRRWISDHGKIATTRNIRTKKLESPGVDMTAFQRKEGARGVDKTWPFAKADSGKGRAFDDLFQELQAEGFNGTIDDAWEMLEGELTRGVKRKTEKQIDAELKNWFSEQGKELYGEPLTTETAAKKFKIPETELRKIQKALFELNDLIEGTSHEAAQISPSSKNVLNRELMEIKNEVLRIVGEASPEFIKANAKFEEMSGPITRLKNSVVGQLTRMRSEKEIARAPHKLLDVSSMPDSVLLFEAKKTIGKQDPELWREMVGSYVRDVYEGLKVTEEGRVVNALGKLQKRLFGSAKQRELMESAMTPEDYKKFSDLMTVFQKASIGTGKESMTQPFRMIEEQFGKIPGSKIYRFAMFPRQATTEALFGKWNDIIVMGRQSKLMEALKSPEVVSQISNIKKMTPGSQKMLDAFGVLTVLVYEKMPEWKTGETE